MSAALGRCPLERGGALEACRLEYRIFGTLSRDRRNAVLLLTWFGGKVDDWLPLFGPAGMIDTTRFFAIAVQSLGTAPSSSPSVSTGQPGRLFPPIGIGDIIEAEYRLAHEVLALPELYAIVGISLGGVPSFGWGVSHPEYVRRIVAIGGTPRLSVYSRAMWELITRAADDGASGGLPRDSALAVIARFVVLSPTTTAFVDRRAPSTSSDFLASQVRTARGIDINEWSIVARATLSFDVARNVGASLENAAARWRARTFVVVAANDHLVSPRPALDFARSIRADTLVLPNANGHQAIFGDSTEKAVVRRFLSPLE